MRPTHLEEVVRQAPFKAFDIHIDNRTISVNHPEQIMLTPDKSVAVVATEDNHLRILDVDLISSVTVKPQRRSRKAA